MKNPKMYYLVWYNRGNCWQLSPHSSYTKAIMSQSCNTSDLEGLGVSAEKYYNKSLQILLMNKLAPTNWDTIQYDVIKFNPKH